MTTNNDSRIQRAQIALATYPNGWYDFTALPAQDLITDLLHYIRFTGEDAQTMLDSAFANFEAEAVHSEADHVCFIDDTTCSKCSS